MVQTVRRRWLMEELNALLLALPASGATVAGDVAHV
ncbi:hypothetical protein Y695_03355 [Hydrogenophaga sp. T4]|nr:hypothetical protein Y695_03355 [Hydrogenophaga sp. T4]